EQENGPARHLIILFGQCVRIVWWSKRRAPPYDAMDVDVGQPSELGVPRAHAPDVASERDLSAMLVFCVIECVVQLWARAEGGVVGGRRQGQRGAAAATAD